MTTTDVIVVGAGPTGLMLACELAMRGVGVRVLERRATSPNITRAFAVHARTLELLDARGLADDLVAKGVPVYEVAPAPGAVLNLRELPSRYPMLLIAPQSATEHLLEARSRELGVDMVRGADVVDLRQDAEGVTLSTAGGEQLRARYVVGCDGAHSAVRDLVGVDFVGKQYQTHIALADVRLTEPPEEAMFARTSAEGVVLIVPFGDGWFRAIAWDRQRENLALDVPVTITEMRESFAGIAGTDFGMTEMRWSSRFLSERRQARSYRVGQVFLAGDAAHVHSPLGGQGMNTGIQDATNLGWKLAAAVAGTAGEGLLDSYEQERHPVGAQVLRLTDAFNQLVLGRSAPRRLIRRVVITALLGARPGRRLMGGLLSGIGIRYPRHRGEPALVGRRMPDVVCADGRLYELLRDGGFVLLTRGAEAAGRPGVRVAAHTDPQLPAEVLVRPDGYVAWTSRGGGPNSPLGRKVREIDGETSISALDRWVPLTGVRRIPTDPPARRCG